VTNLTGQLLMASLLEEVCPHIVNSICTPQAQKTQVSQEL